MEDNDDTLVDSFSRFDFHKIGDENTANDKFGEIEYVDDDDNGEQ